MIGDGTNNRHAAKTGFARKEGVGDGVEGVKLGNGVGCCWWRGENTESTFVRSCENSDGGGGTWRRSSRCNRFIDNP